MSTIINHEHTKLYLDGVSKICIGPDWIRSDHGSNHGSGFQRASSAGNGRSSRISRSIRGLCDWWNNAQLSLAFVPWWRYTTLLDTAVKVTTWGFWVQKKKFPVGSALHYVTQTNGAGIQEVFGRGIRNTGHRNTGHWNPKSSFWNPESIKIV